MAAAARRSDWGSRRSSRGRTPSGDPNPIDIHVGARVRQRRTLLGMSQQKLARALGITFQQVQKYESGANRVGSSRLFDISRVLDVPLAYFFEDMPDEAARGSPRKLAAGASVPRSAPLPFDPMSKRETLELVRAWGRISDAALRKRILDLARAFANTGGSEEE